jgi:hypothetical protein
MYLYAALQQHHVALLRHRASRRQHQQLALDQLLLQVLLQRCQVLPHPCCALLPAHALVARLTRPARQQQGNNSKTASQYKSAVLFSEGAAQTYCQTGANMLLHCVSSRGR